MLIIFDTIARAVDEGGSGNIETVRELERRFCAHAEFDHALCVSSGTAALIAAMWALGVRPGHRVGVSALAPAMTVLAVMSLNATPYFLDVRAPNSFGLSPCDLEEMSNGAFNVVISVPMWGYWDEDIASLRSARAHGLKVIVDAAQAPFLRLSTALATEADITCLSLHSRKPLKAGEGGVVLTNNLAYAERALALRNFGQETEVVAGALAATGPFASSFGSNFKINGLGAAWCLDQMARLPELRASLERLRGRAHAALTAADYAWTEANQSDEVAEHGRYGLVAIYEDTSAKDIVTRMLLDSEVDVDTARYRYAPVSVLPLFAKFARPCPNASRLAETAVAVRLEAMS